MGNPRRIRARALLAPLAALLLLGLAACATPTTTPPPSPLPDVRTETDWNLALLSHETADDLRATQAAVLYDGEKVDVSFTRKPGTGNTFLLLEIRVEKTRAGAPAFRWADVRVEDAAGNAWSRLDNDTFLTNFNFPRVPSTDLTFGTNEGFVCFEIPESAAAGPLALVHETGTGRTRIVLR
jgi:hypothetical protein